MTKRITLPPLGEHDDDWVTILAWLYSRSRSSQAAALISVGVAEQKAEVESMLEYIAQKRSITVGELVKSILGGTIDDDRDESIEEE
ncbi:hypothetical protein [Phormidesmis priestleyi]|jgi:hypothetical protein